MRLIITGGGTGGHVYPGLAVARELSSRSGAHTILYVGSRKGLEMKLAPSAGLDFEGLNVSGLKGKTIMGKAKSVLALVGACLRSLAILRRADPDVVLGVGGYASAPVCLAAIVTGRRIAIAEQNAAPGLTNRKLGRFAKKVFLPWPGMERIFPEGAGKLTGNPVAPEFFEIEKKPQGGVLNVLVIGGSQGASSLNNAMAWAAPLLDKVADQVEIVHQTGANDVEMMQTIYRNSRFRWTAQPFFHDMPRRMADADLVISRAGAGAVSEICAAGRAAVYVPYPRSADNHQERNAERAVNAGAAMLVSDDDLDGRRLAGIIQMFLGDRGRLEKMGDRAGKLAMPGAAGKIVDELLEMAGETQ